MTLALTWAAAIGVVRIGWKSDSVCIFKIGPKKFPDDFSEGSKKERTQE